MSDRALDADISSIRYQRGSLSTTGCSPGASSMLIETEPVVSTDATGRNKEFAFIKGSTRSSQLSVGDTYPVQLLAKRLIDIATAAVALAMLAPLLLSVAAVIRLESRGPVFFRQKRIGRNGKTFSIVKFRTMRSEMCDSSGLAQTIDGDPRITRIGHVLRRSNLDELPQLWNILVGDMSLVGPRPHVPGMLAAGRPYDELVEGYGLRHRMRPGLTGLAQSRGLRGPTDTRWKAVRRVDCDVDYIRNFSLLLDAKIILRTLINELGGGTGS